MVAPAQAIVFQVATGAPCALLIEDPKQGRLFWGARNRSGKKLCCALDTKLSVSSLGKLKEGATLSASSGLLYRALTSRGKCRLEECPILNQPEFAADRQALAKLLE